MLVIYLIDISLKNKKYLTFMIILNDTAWEIQEAVKSGLQR